MELRTRKLDRSDGFSDVGVRSGDSSVLVPDIPVGSSQAANSVVESFLSRLGDHAPLVLEHLDDFADFIASKRASGERFSVETPRLSGETRGDLDFRDHRSSSVVEAGAAVAMAQIKAPQLEGLKIPQIKSFHLAYRRYVSRVPVLAWVRPPGQFVLLEHLQSLAVFNKVSVEDLVHFSSDVFFGALCSIHNATMTSQWCRLMEQVRMTSSTWALEDFFDFRDNFNFQLLIAGDKYAPPAKEIVRIFIAGLQPSSLQLEMRRRELATLAEAMDGTALVIVQYRAIFDIQGSLSSSRSAGRVEVRRDGGRRPVSKSESVESSSSSSMDKPRGGEATDRKAGPICHKCLQAGHYANRCPNPQHPQSAWKARTVRVAKKRDPVVAPVENPVARSIRVFASDMDPSDDTFIRLDVVVMPADLVAVATPGHSGALKSTVFVDSGANLNSITRDFFLHTLLPAFPDLTLLPGSPFQVELAGGKFTTVSGESVQLRLQLETVSGPVQFVESFYVFEVCGEPFSIGVSTLKSLLGKPGLAELIFGTKGSQSTSPEELEFPAEVQLFPDNVSHGDRGFAVCDQFPDQRGLQAVIEKHSSVLFGEFDPSGLRVPPMDIELCDACSVGMQPARFINKQLLPQVKAEIDRLVSWRVLEPVSDARIASPLVIVRKSDGNIRLAVDYRELNRCIVPSANQLPLQGQLFDQLAGQVYFAKLDLLWGYHQLALTPRAQEFCSIVTPWGLYAMRMLGFGISTAPGIYHNRISSIVGDYLLNGCVVYIDDLIIYGKSVSEFLSRLDAILFLLVQHNVRLKPSKCAFGFTEVLFLGHLFSSSGYELSDDRKNAIMGVSVPTTVVQLKSFLGLVNYFRDFIPNLSSLCAPLSDLTKGRVKGRIPWSSSCESAFHDIKSAVASALRLTWPNETDPLILYTDASDHGVGALLVQVQSGVECPIACFSRKFSDAARRWSTIEQECFAIFAAIMHFQGNLLGRRFLIKTDHRNLVYLQSSVVPKVIRWRLRLLEFDFMISHVPGVDNVVADTLSRSFMTKGVDELDESALVGVLSQQEKLQRFQSIHNDIVGHHGLGKTVDLLVSSGLEWPGFRTDLLGFIKGCLVCQKFKVHKSATGVSTLHIHGTLPMKSLSIDAIGPFPTDEFGNSYILGIIDNFSKFINLIPIKSTTALEFVRGLLVHVGIFGIPESIRTDGGTQFTASVCSELSKLLKYDHLVIVPYHPQANGIIERRNAEVLKHLRILVAERDLAHEWSRILPLVQRILNFTKDGSIDTSPSQLLFGNMLPTDVSILMSSVDGSIRVSDYLKSLQSHQSVLIKRSQDYLTKQVDYRDHKVPISNSRSFKVGDYVLLSYPSRPPTKLAGLYRGPLIIHRQLHPDIYEVLDLITDRIYEVHVSRMHLLTVSSSVDRMDVLRLAGLDHHELVVDSIVDHRGNPRRRNRMEFLVRWKGFEPADDTWESYQVVKDLQALDVYSREHPELALG